MSSVSGTRAVQDPAGLTEAAILLIDFNREYDYPVPESDWLAAHLDTLVKSGDTSVLTFGTPAIGVAILRFRAGTLSADIEAYLAEHTEADFSHGVCPECARKIDPEGMEEDL